MHPDSKNYQGLQRLKSYGFSPSGILDIGAYNGDWSRGVRRIYPDAYVLMVDGLTEKEPILRQVCAEIGNADYVLTLLGAEERETSFFVVLAGNIQTGSSVYKENTGYPTEERNLSQRTLNSVLSEHPRQQFQLIKLDVQGAELDVLAGASQHLHRAEAVLMEVSTLQYNRGGPLVADVIPRMQALGFVLFDILDEIRFGNGYLFQFDALFVRPDAAFRPQPPF
jgi:FkbM family methyltransferase